MASTEALVPQGLTESDLLELYRRMVLLRTYDERSVVFHRQGRIGTYAIFWNHEAIQAGATFALDDDDWIFPSYRESAIGLVRGMPVETILQWWRGHPSGWWNPADWNVASIAVPIASHVPHAAGLAWGKKLRGEDAVAMAFFGDGATSEGEFHEGGNRAAPHATADDPRAYIDLERVERERANECVGRFERVLQEAGILAEERVEAVRREAEDLLRAGIAAAEAEPAPDPELLFAHAYVN